MNLHTRLERLENTREGRIATAIRTQNFRPLTDDELNEVVGMAEASLRAQGYADDYFAGVDEKLRRLTDEQLELVCRGLPLEAIA